MEKKDSVVLEAIVAHHTSVCLCFCLVWVKALTNQMMADCVSVEVLNFFSYHWFTSTINIIL